MSPFNQCGKELEWFSPIADSTEIQKDVARTQSHN